MGDWMDATLRCQLRPPQRCLYQLVLSERGGLGLNAVWVCFVIIFLIPFFWDVGSLFYARRFAGTGADAAALAAAQEYARALQQEPMLNGIWRGKCELGEFTPQQVVQRYLLQPAFFAPPSIGNGAAQQYARSNRDQLMNYQSWPEYTARNVVGVPIPQIKVAVNTQRTVETAYRPIYGRDFEVPNQALAVAYLDRWTVTTRPCPGKMPPTYDFGFWWKITLDRVRA